MNDQEFGSIVGCVNYQGDIHSFTYLLHQNGIRACGGLWAIRFPEISDEFAQGDFELQYVGNLSDDWPYDV